MILRTWLILLLAFFIQRCHANVRYASVADSGRYSHAKFKEGQSFVGMASYYGKKFHGRKTANGEIFNMYGYSAAHRTLPFGTILKVINLNNGKSVIVKVNDRGPFKKNRILDLSYAAAKDLAMLQSGTAKVKIIILKLGES